MAVKIRPHDAYNALMRRVTGDQPISADFYVPNPLCIVMNIYEDGECQKLKVVLSEDGTWYARYEGDI